MVFYRLTIYNPVSIIVIVRVMRIKNTILLNLNLRLIIILLIIIMSDTTYQQLLNIHEEIEEENEKELCKILQDLRQLNEINHELGFLLHNQRDDLDNIEDIQENIVANIETANDNLESAVRRRIKFIPIIVGGVVGVGIFGPGALILGAKGAAAYIAGAAGILGGIAGKSLS